MGATTSKLERALVDLPDGEKYFGLENFGNTCYCNSVLQALYFCKPFRERLLQYASVTVHNGEENLLTALADLFTQVCVLHRRRARGGCVGGWGVQGTRVAGGASVVVKGGETCARGHLTRPLSVRRGRRSARRSARQAWCSPSALCSA